MDNKYNFSAIEKKWQDRWEAEKAFEAVDFSEKPKFYGLIEFPYPSGVGLHVGHIRAFTSIEIVSRKRRLEGFNVLFPIGWDAFGLPTENYAIKTGQDPRDVTAHNVAVFTEQLKAMGYSFDWDRTVDTTDPDYYKWTQWIFLQMFKNGLAYKSKTFVNFCPKCKVVLSNEDCQGGICGLCGEEVVQREKDVWFLRIRDYSEKLLEGLETVNYPDRIKTEQVNWIGKSQGAEVDFTIAGSDDKLTVYTTRPDTLYGVTFMVIAPEHPYIEKYASQIKNMDAIRAYQDEAHKKNEFERIQLVKDKSGVIIDGLEAVNPLTGKNIPIFIADYVMMGYGTGAIMAVPAHDDRDWDFAQLFKLPIIEVVKGGNVQEAAFTDCNTGIMVNSGILDGLSVEEAKVKIIDHLESTGIGHRKINYNMKDWAFNRQRYWGEPIPIVNCPHCGMVPVPEEELPLRLPEVAHYEPTVTGESPLANITDWVNCKCPVCGADAKRETDTMPQWAGSSWYFLRYMDPHNDQALADMDKMKYWGQVDWYNGGMEHVTRHMIYSRFWHRALYDIGAVPFPEPYAKRSYQGLILGEDGEKMSKSRGNVVDPREYVNLYGADVLRTFMMFIGDYGQPAPWNSSSIVGVKRFLDRVWSMQEWVVDGDDYLPQHKCEMHTLIKKVSEDIEAMKFNTAIAAMMSFTNQVASDKQLTKKEFSDFLKLLYPFAPHICEELWEVLGNSSMLAQTIGWPEYDEKAMVKDSAEIVLQVNGKIKARLEVPTSAGKEELEALARSQADFDKWIDGKTIAKFIVVPGKLINIVVK